MVSQTVNKSDLTFTFVKHDNLKSWRVNNEKCILHNPLKSLTGKSQKLVKTAKNNNIIIKKIRH